MTSERNTPASAAPEKKPKVAVAIYARSATPSHNSISRQKTVCRKFAGSIGGKIVATYTDNGASGTTRRRESLDRMLNDARAGLFSAVIVESVERLARSPSCAINLLDEFASLKVNVRTVRRGPSGSTN
jgi:DNA invertase Pin-like site-specific DNA recombinase